MIDSADLAKFVSDGVDLAKAGKAAELYNQILPYFENSTLPVTSHYGFGWITYYAIHQSGDANFLQRKRMLATYMGLTLRRPHKLHSMILLEAIRLYRNLPDNDYRRPSAQQPSTKDIPAFSIIRFMELWKFANLREGDWRRKSVNGNITPSTTEKLITCYIDELTSKPGLTPADDFLNIVNKALTQYPDSVNLLAQYAALCQHSGDTTRAADYLSRAILISPTKPYLWQRLAAILPSDTNPRLKIALLYKALTAPGQENFKGRIRLSLASVMAESGAWQQAAWEVEKVEKFYAANGWQLPGEGRRLKDLISTGTQPADPTEAYRKIEHLAEEYLYNSLPSQEAKKTYHKPAQTPAPDSNPRHRAQLTAWRVTDSNGTNYWFNPAKHNIREDLPHGTRLLIRTIGNRIVRAELVESEMEK